MELVSVKLLVNLSVIVLLLLLSMTLPANCASVAIDGVQSMYEAVGSADLNGLAQRYGSISDGERFIYITFFCICKLFFYWLALIHL